MCGPRERGAPRSALTHSVYWLISIVPLSMASNGGSMGVVLNTFVLPETQQITEAVAGSVTTLLVALVGSFTPPSARDQIVV